MAPLTFSHFLRHCGYDYIPSYSNNLFSVSFKILTKGEQNEIYNGRIRGKVPCSHMVKLARKYNFTVDLHFSQI